MNKSIGFNNENNILEVNATVSAFMTVAETPKIYDETVADPVPIKGKTNRGYVPWGEDNNRPKQIIDNIQKDETLGSNLLFNVLAGYGAGFAYNMADGSEVPADIKTFFRRNRPVKYWLEQQTDMKHFFFSIAVIILTNDGKKICKLVHKEAKNCRFETCNPTTGDIENVIFANWEDLKEDEVETIPLLDEDDPIGDLYVRMGKEVNPQTGKKEAPVKDRKFAMVMKFPTVGLKYYPFPPYWAHFNSGWFDIKQMIALGKKAKMKHGMRLKYIVEFHPHYFDDLYDSEGITDPAKQKVRHTQEQDNIKNFLSGIENSGKTWFTGYYIDPVKGNEVPGVKITNIDTKKEGGDWIEDTEEAVAMQCYATMVHPSVVGAVPGKSKNINGTEARELFTMKQSLERAFRDLMMLPIDLVCDYNGWENLVYDIPDLMLTTLDKGSDAEKATSKPQSDDIE